MKMISRRQFLSGGTISLMLAGFWSPIGAVSTKRKPRPTTTTTTTTTLQTSSDTYSRYNPGGGY